MENNEAIVEGIRQAATPIAEAKEDYDALLEAIGNDRFVLLGEATHGTHEFYRERARITKRLLEEKGFGAVAIEADWPDAYRVNRYVQGSSHDASSFEALAGFERFPTWMWRNTDVVNFVDWLRTYNDGLAGSAPKAGFYGLDLYSLYGSIDAVLNYLERVDPEAATRARYRYSCFDHFGEDSQAYGYAANFDLSRACIDEVIDQLLELQRHASTYSSRDGRVAADEFFYAEQNARLVKNAEEYYRTMFRGRVHSWNRRDRHMAETLEALSIYRENQGLPAKIVVWEHNSHVGDARATELGEEGELNVGQLMRQRHGSETTLVGFTTYSGRVTAASGWGEAAERKRVRQAIPESYESCFHETGIPHFLLRVRRAPKLISLLQEARSERAIGVVYVPETERVSHYFRAHLARQFDAVVHMDETTAVEPLEKTPLWKAGEAAESYPSGL